MKSKGIFVTGTDTGVGKTQVAAGLAGVLQRKLRLRSSAFAASAAQVRLWKPVQTGAPLGSKETDSCRLKRVSGVDQIESDIVSLNFEHPLAPWIAAQRVQSAIDYGVLLEDGQRRLSDCEYLIIEGAGGLAVPLTESKLIADLVQDMSLPLLIVARPGLGTVNHTLLSAAYARSLGIDIIGVVINGVKQTEDPHRLQENIMMIERFGGVPVLGVLPWLPHPDDEAVEDNWADWSKEWIDCFERQVDVKVIL